MSEASRKLEDSKTRRKWATGAVRDGATGKGRLDLMPYHAIFRIATVFEKGAIKYAPRNWEKGMPLSNYLDSGLRHGFKELDGWTDEDHAAQAAWNFICYMATKEWIRQGILPPELDDIPLRKVRYGLARSRRRNHRKARRSIRVRKTRR